MGIYLLCYENSTILKEAAAAGPAWNAYFDLHFVEIRSIKLYINAIDVNNHYKKKEMGFMKMISET